MPQTDRKGKPYRAPDRDVLIASLAKNATTQIRVSLARFNPTEASLSAFKGPTDSLQIREWYLWAGKNADDKYMEEWRPTTKGITINMEHGPELLHAIYDAIQKETEWLDE